MSQKQPARRRGRSQITRPVDYPTVNEIAERAHDLFVANGRRVGKIFEYWNQAEQELLERAARRAPDR